MDEFKSFWASAAAFAEFEDDNKFLPHSKISLPYTVSRVIPTDNKVFQDKADLAICFHTGTPFNPSSLNAAFSFLIRDIWSTNIGILLEIARKPVWSDTENAGNSRVN